MLKRLGVVGVATATMVGAGLATQAIPAHASPGYVVNTSADSFSNSDCSGSNTCTLRDAVNLANIAGGPSTITFASSVTQPITLSLGTLFITNDLVTITGNGPTVTIIDGSRLTNSGVFDVFYSTCHGPCSHTSPRVPAGPAGTLTLNDLTVRNSTHAGNGGVAVVEAQATFNSTDVVFSGNTASGGGGAIFNDGTTTISGSTFSGNTAGLGGAIDNDGGATSVDTSTFASNTATNNEGGAVYSQFAALHLTRSLFTLNQAVERGGALYDLDNKGTADISNDTFSGNKADDGDGGGSGGAGFFVGGTLGMVNDTFTGNTAAGSGGAIATDIDDSQIAPTLIVSNTLVAADSAPDCTDTNGTTVTSATNIDSGASCGFTDEGSHEGATGLHLDTQLRDNGGPTQTVALLPGSTAVDAGNSITCRDVDQRGVSRPQGETCDVGAFEVDRTTTTIVASQQYAGGDLTLTATVTGTTTDAGVPQGTVTFTKNGAVVGAAPINSSGVATLTLPVTSAADPSFAAAFAPANGFFASTGSVGVTPALESAPVPVPAAGAGTPRGGVLLVLGGLGLLLAARRRL